MSKKPTIGLNMIMKNESRVLLRLLESIYKIIDTYVIVDTGSSDNSKQIVKDFFYSKNIKGEILDYEWDNYCNARNYAMDNLKGKADYGFFINASDTVVIDDNFHIDYLKDQIIEHDLISITATIGNTEYSRPNIFKLSSGFYWKHVVHECLMNDNTDVSCIVAEDIQTKINNDGATWSDIKKKYGGHAEILLKEVELHNNPRDVFYLAQSYRDCEQNEKSIEWYRKRVEMTDGYNEERYCSQLCIGELVQRMNGSIEEIAAEWIKCGDLDDLRAEHLGGLYSIYREAGNQGMRKFYWNELGRFSGKNPYPKRQLFLNPHCYK